MNDILISIIMNGLCITLFHAANCNELRCKK